MGNIYWFICIYTLSRHVIQEWVFSDHIWNLFLGIKKPNCPICSVAFLNETQTFKEAVWKIGRLGCFGGLWAFKTILIFASWLRCPCFLLEHLNSILSSGSWCQLSISANEAAWVSSVGWVPTTQGSLGLHSHLLAPNWGHC